MGTKHWRRFFFSMFLFLEFSSTSSVTLDTMSQHCRRSRISGPSASWKLPATCRLHLIASFLILILKEQLLICNLF